MVLGAGFLTFLALLVQAWRNRDSIERAWNYRRIFPPLVFWGVAALYTLSGMSTTLPAFGAGHIGINTASASMQAFAVFGIVSIVFVRIAAGKLATPTFEYHAVPQHDRNVFHGQWMAFWMLGFLLGGFPVFIW
jgi:hypothetical protein